MSGSITQPKRGDTDLKFGFRPYHIDGLPFSPFTDISLPTAHPKGAGSQTRQLGVGVKTEAPFIAFAGKQSTHHFSWSAEINQNLSLASKRDEARDVNYTKFDLGLQDNWRRDIPSRRRSNWWLTGSRMARREPSFSLRAASILRKADVFP